MSVKTQYCGAAGHKVVIHLLDYLSKKYFKSFKLRDEGQYWETRDEKLLDKNFEHLTALIESVVADMESSPLNPGETLAQYFHRIFKLIHTRF